MDHYLLCLLNGDLSEKDHDIIEKCLTTFFPTSYQYQHAACFMKSLAVLLNPVSKYIAVVDASGEIEEIEWKLLDEDEKILDVIQIHAAKPDSIESDPHDTTDCVSTLLHSLADQLPAFGTYKLDILVGSNVLKELSVCKEPALASAFIRLTRWHSAHFTIFEQKKFDVDRLNEWCEIINADILLPDSKLNLGPPLWRGAVEVQCSNAENAVYRGFQLCLDLLVNHHCGLDSVQTNIKQVTEHIVLSSKLQVIDEVSFVSIPPYLIAPVPFQLHISKPNVINEKSSSMLDYLCKNEKVALIVKLGYATMKEKVKSERKYCLNRWQKAIFSSHINDAECFVSSFENFITFAITKSNSSDFVVAYPLLDPANLKADFYFNIINHRICNEPSQWLPRKKCSLNVPLMSYSVCQKVFECLKENMNLVKGSRSSENVGLASVMEKFKHSSFCTLSETMSLANMSVEEIDPSDWPERICLLNQQMKNEDGEKNDSTTTSLVQKAPQQSFSFSSDNITEHFLPSGESKNEKNLQIVYSNSNSNIILSGLKEVLQSSWPDLMNCIYHDLYYNFSYQAEDKESLGSQLVKLYVQHETASSCSYQQLTQNFHVIVPDKLSTPSKAFRGPSSRLSEKPSPSIKKTETITSNISQKISSSKMPRLSSSRISNVLYKQKHRRKDPSPRKNMNDLLTKTILFTSHTSHGTSVKTSSKGKSKISAKGKNLVPVRCSPRKKNPVSYKNPSVNSTTSKSSKSSSGSSNSESKTISDVLRKKIRHAVAEALEANGINSTHPMYHPCGRKLLSICKSFLEDLKFKKGKTSEYLQKIANAHVKQVIDFYKD